MGFKSRYQGRTTIESPEALFYDLRNRKVEGLLSHQADMLRAYKEALEEHADIAMELPTGSGKTLIGLLIGEYRRREMNERVVYLCPTRQLVHQVVEEARVKYDIHPLAFTGSRRDYDPRAKSMYSDGEAIAVTTYSSLFNTNPYFHNPNFIILDDAHAAENYVGKYWSLSISRFDHEWIYKQLLEILQEDIPFDQYQRMVSDSPSTNDKVWVEKVPTPRLVRRLHQIIPFLDESTQNIDSLKYTWSVLRDHLNACHMYINWNSILVRPFIPPTISHEAFASSNQRLYMSATLGLGGELERITGRMNIHRISAPEGWDKHGVGRRLFFFPGTSLKEHECNQLVFDLVNESSRALLLVPDDATADQWKSRFATETDRRVFQAEDIEQTKSSFTNHQNAIAILANRYDGINLAGDECRLEIMMGLPSAVSLQERFLESRMAASLLLRDRIRTRLVQAIGRCTRSATDYSTVCIIGDDLQDKLLQRENIQLFHPELQAELQFGREESKVADNIDDFIKLYQYFLDQSSPEWRGADREIIARRQDTTQISDPLMDILQTAASYELLYQEEMWSGNYERALGVANNISTLLSGDELKGYRGLWYYLAGSAAWLAGQTEPSFLKIAKRCFTQASRCTNSVTWLRNLVDENSIDPQESQDPYLPFLIERLEIELTRLGTTSDRKFENLVSEILSGLSDQKDSKRFESAHQKLGQLLGYESGNTDANSGPDPWWIAGNDFCLAAEDYTETDGTKPITTYKVRQVNDHPVWIKDKFPWLSENTVYVRVIISPSTTIERSAVAISKDVYYWNQQDFVKWAHNAISVLRTLRLDFNGTGDEYWRTKAMEAYMEAGIDPLSLKDQLFKNPVSNLQLI